MSFSVTTLPGGMPADEFLRDYWQKKPLLIRQAFADFESPLSADELAGLSLEEEVESRIVLEQGATPWELRHGPFTEDDYRKLPERNWTLLVQAVDQFVPEVAELLQAFRFLPSWRVDDVMISYAAPGGSVGPHYDNYDVFLLQGQGHRRWKVGQPCDVDSPLLQHPDLRILSDFQRQDEWVLGPGDMLYLPPGLAHYGIAEDECMTYSVGFRAPSHAEVVTHFSDFLGQYLGDHQRYSDAGLSLPTDPAQIDEQTVDRLQKLLLELVQDKEALGTWFGRFMTEPRYPEMIAAQELDEQLLSDALEQGYGLVRNPTARLAWRQEQDEYLMLFASGEHCLLPTRLLPLVQLICNRDYLDAEQLQAWRQDDEATLLLEQLLSKGDLLLEADEDE
ncbi:MAG TPA: cupin domain-containing protein [Candidatus Pseudomonas excrementavium]|uniref:ribosomal protein uL16 3-hydroxylase n=1 Tax=Halopseudomonas bauzanensis TaxID=653930 RepID=UPI001C397DDD|nr:cupin domain-containing protein [Halopseudomonas bauzanensis]HIZ51013.1 cupin domain-containing protein [Candidatus Pseudomonas excrementavium]